MINQIDLNCLHNPAEHWQIPEKVKAREDANASMTTMHKFL